MESTGDVLTMFTNTNSFWLPFHLMVLVCVYANVGQTNKFFGRMVSYPIGILQKLKAIKLLSWKVLVIDLFFGYLFI